jgi:type I restriction enzyme, S subunit
MTDLPESWARVKIPEVLQANNNGKPFQQGWSPQCDRAPASDGKWGVLKTTAIQRGEFWDHENKALPDHLEARPQIEVKPGDVLMTCAGPRSRCGVTCLVERTRSKLMMSGKMYRFRPHPEIMHPKYLAYFLQTRGSQLEIDRMKTGISDSGLNLTHDRFTTLEVVVAPLNEQHRIVQKVDELFSEIDNGVQILSLARDQLLSYRQAVLKQAFEGSLSADWRAKNRCNLTNVNVLRRQLLEDRRAIWEKKQTKRYKPPICIDPASLPALPREWCWTSLDELVSGEPRSLQSGPFGSNLKHSEFRAEGILVIGIDNVTNGNFSMGSQNRIPVAKFKQLQKYEARPGDLLITVMASLGRTCVVPRNLERAIITKHVYRVSMNEKFVLPEFYNLALQSPTLSRKQMLQSAQGQTRPGLNGSIIKEIPLPLCSIEEQHEIVARVNEALSEIDNLGIDLSQQVQRGEALRQSVLNMAFSGKLVAQNANEESAAMLLERINKRKAA